MHILTYARNARTTGLGTEWPPDLTCYAWYTLVWQPRHTRGRGVSLLGNDGDTTMIDCAAWFLSCGGFDWVREDAALYWSFAT